MQEAFDVAARQIGLNENDKAVALQEYLRNGGENLDPAVTAWCAAFVNATLAQSGMEGTGALNARSYLDWGQEVTEPQRGDVAVFSRGDPNGWQGHVGFFDGYNDDGTIRVLGGNQNDGVNVSSYGADRLLGFRRIGPGGAAAPQMAGQPAPQPSAGRGPTGDPDSAYQAYLEGRMSPEQQQAYMADVAAGRMPVPEAARQPIQQQPQQQQRQPMGIDPNAAMNVYQAYANRSLGPSPQNQQGAFPMYPGFSA